MNSAARRLLLFFFSFATLTACDDPNDIGIELQDENLIGTEFTEISAQTATVLQTDSILAFRSPTALAGQYVDPVLGLVRASTLMEVGLNGNNLNFGSGVTADSLVLTLDYSFKYADTLKTMQVNVHRLTGAFDERTSYFTNTPFAYDPNPIGSALFQPRIDEVDVEGVKTKRTRLLRVTLDSQLANEFLAQSGQPTFANQANFLNYFRGIALVVPQDENGSVVGFNLTSTTSNLTLHYKSSDGTNRQHAFVLGRDNYFSQIASDRAATAVANLQTKGNIVPASETGGDSYVQGGTQLLTKFTFPDLAALKNSQRNIIINRAELIIPIKASSTSNNKPLPPQLVMYETNEANEILRDVTGAARTIQQDGVNPFATNFAATLTYNNKEGEQYYSLNITNYLQAIMTNQKPNNGLLLGAATVASETSGSRSVRAELSPYRAIITNTEASPVKVLIYFSKLQ